MKCMRMFLERRPHLFGLHFVSGTHTIGTALFGVLRPGDELMYITGRPYDTLHKVIGKPSDGTGSLQDWGVSYSRDSAA